MGSERDRWGWTQRKTLQHVVAIMLVLCIFFPRLATSECPNACSAHGTCGPYDMCRCFKNFMGGDCAEKVCQYGRAHVDTPKGDLDADELISGPDVNVIRLSHLYPYGTAEQYPNMKDSRDTTLTNTAHEYRECSNKGKCDRRRGECECLNGYGGSACQRAECPDLFGETCAGHGVCKSAFEIAKMDYANVYELWDSDMTMGCVCDAGYSSPGCELRRCKKGKDPVFHDDEGSTRYANISYVIHANMFGPNLEGYNNITGNYSILFTDTYGENWRTGVIGYNADCLEVIDALEKLPNSVIPYGTVRCQKWSDYNQIPESDEPFLVSPTNEGPKLNPFFGVKYTLAFPSNPGVLQPIAVDRYLDGQRPTLFTSERNNTSLGVFVYPNGFQGEEIEYFTEKCRGVDVTIENEASTRIGVVVSSEHSYLGDLSSFEKRLLAKCLGDADGNEHAYSMSDNVEGEAYNWDYGTIFNPHLVRLVDRSDPTTIATDLCDRYTDEAIANGSHSIVNANSDPSADGGRSGNKGRTCTYSVSPPGFIVPLYWDPILLRFVLMTRPAGDYSTSTSFAIWTTSGHTQMVSNDAAIYTSESTEEFYSSTVYSTNSTSTYSNEDYLGNLECEINKENVNGVNTCLNKEDRVFFLDTDRFDRNPKYMNLYTIKKLHVYANRSRDHDYHRYDGRDNTQRNRIELDYAINSRFENVNGTYSTRIYKFYPPKGYPYVTECSNRGICNEFTGVCDCFSGYMKDDCSEMNVFAL